MAITSDRDSEKEKIIEAKRSANRRLREIIANGQAWPTEEEAKDYLAIEEKADRLRNSPEAEHSKEWETLYERMSVFVVHLLTELKEARIAAHQRSR
jgi:hypothetical protein